MRKVKKDTAGIEEKDYSKREEKKLEKIVNTKKKNYADITGCLQKRIFEHFHQPLRCRRLTFAYSNCLRSENISMA